MTVIKQILNELNKVMLNTIEKTIKIADKHNFDRDETIKTMAEKFSLLAEVGTFAKYEIKENSADTPQNSAGGWIPCEKELPQENEPVGTLCEIVNVMLKNGIVTSGWCNRYLEKWYALDHNCDYPLPYEYKDVIAWQPLPQPYKEV